ncbi:MAG: lanthionine synthetase LanC family protein [Minisyncoccia bacterium]
MENRFLQEEIDSIYLKITDAKKNDHNGIYWETGNLINQTGISENIYSGLSGIILFLIEYYKLNKNSETLNIIEKSSTWLANYCYTHPTTNYAFYTGRVGTLYTLLRAGQLTKNSQLRDVYFTHIEDIKKIPNLINVKYEFLNGMAGTILGLLHIYIETKNSIIKDVLIKLIQSTLKNTNILEFGFFWDKTVHSSKALCGFSHGTSGIGFVFLELGKFFKNELFLEIAERAFDYEDYYYNKKYQNWPDFRKGIYNKSIQQAYISQYEKGNIDFFITPSYMNAWCHGAPGIGLTRIRGYEILKKEKYRNSLINAFNGTFNHSKISPFTSAALCHGTIGNSSLFLEMYKQSRNVDYLNLYKKSCYKAIENKNKLGFYKSGIKDSNQIDLSFFNGISGIGYGFIQAMNPEVFSLLLPCINQDPTEGLDEFDNTFFTKSMFSKYYPNTEALISHDPSINFKILTDSIPKISNIIKFQNLINEEVKFIYYLERKKNKIESKITSYSLLNIKKIINNFKLKVALDNNSIGNIKLHLNSLVITSYHARKDIRFLMYPNETEYKLVQIDKQTHSLLKELKTPQNLEFLFSKCGNFNQVTNSHQRKHLMTFLIELIKKNVILIIDK